jgi:TonB family protein
MVTSSQRLFLSVLISGCIHGVILSVLLYCYHTKESSGDLNREQGIQAKLIYAPVPQDQPEKEGSIAKELPPVKKQDSLLSEPAVKDEEAGTCESTHADTMAKENNKSEETGNRASADAGSDTDMTAVFEDLYEKIRRNTIYPPVARRKELEGTVILSFTLDKDGNYQGSTIISSSGSSMLDRAALTVIKHVLPFTHNTRKSITLSIPITYNLED